MSILSKEAIAESEIILNKTNIALARSRKLIQSWMTQPASEAGAEEDEDDFKPESETAGVGSNFSHDNDGSTVVSLARSRKATNDKLLEQLLGKKAANAHKKSRDLSTAKPTTTSTSQQRKDQSDGRELDEDHEEESRTSALKQSRSKAKRAIDDEPSHPSKSSSTKRKANSYLDELLSKKAMKKARGTG